MAQAVESWLDHGLVGHDPNTAANRRSLAKTHSAARSRLAAICAADRGGCGHLVGDKSATLSDDTLQRLLSILRHSIRRAQTRDLVNATSQCCAMYRKEHPADRQKVISTVSRSPGSPVTSVTTRRCQVPELTASIYPRHTGTDFRSRRCRCLAGCSGQCSQAARLTDIEAGRRHDERKPELAPTIRRCP